MARERIRQDGGIYVGKPTYDVYSTLLWMTTIALVVACSIMYYEFSLLGS
ncbi:MAG: hypothetical protein ACRDD1_08420 [Planctomycetia bacterium]